jgi:hypothetical protein
MSVGRLAWNVSVSSSSVAPAAVASSPAAPAAPAAPGVAGVVAGGVVPAGAVGAGVEGDVVGAVVGAGACVLGAGAGAGSACANANEGDATPTPHIIVARRIRRLRSIMRRTRAQNSSIGEYFANRDGRSCDDARYTHDKRTRYTPFIVSVFTFPLAQLLCCNLSLVYTNSEQSVFRVIDIIEPAADRGVLMMTMNRPAGYVLGLLGGVALLFSMSSCDDLVTPGQVPTNNDNEIVPQTDANKIVVQGKELEMYGGRPVNWVELEPGSRKLKAFKWSLPLRSVESIPNEGKINDALRFWTDVAPEVLQQTVFEGMSIDYLPFGHAPPGIYDLPHWEFHMITRPKAEVSDIDCSDPTLPPDSLLPRNPPGPANWFMIPPPLNCGVGMGIHAMSPFQAEYSKERFRKSVAPAYYHGRLTSMEIKVTRDFLIQRQDFSMDVPKPPTPKEGLYPNTIQAHYDAPNDTYIFSMTDLVQNGSTP